MARVSAETIKKLNEFIESLPEEARSKCALCNETLTHIVKTAEVQTGAGTATVARALSEKMNEGAAPGDQVSGDSLRGRVQREEGIICTEHANNQPTTKPINQRKFWGAISLKLAKLTNEISQKGEFPPDVTDKVKANIKASFNILTLMMEDF